MNIDLLHNKIVIVDDSSKMSLLELLSGKLVNTKIITLSELLKGYLFNYDEKAIYYVCNKYKVCIDVAKRYINSLYYIDNDNSNKKIHYLYNLKQDLISNSLLIDNPLFVKYLTNKDLVLYNLKYIPKIYKKIVNKLSINNNITYLNDELLNNEKTIIKCPTKEDEIALIASKIAKLILDGVDINNIKIINIPNEYEFTIKRIFKDFKIPINLNNKHKVFGSKIVKEFINNFDSDINRSLDSISNLIKTSKDEKIYKSIVSILNKYNWASDYLDIKDFVTEDLKKLSVSSNKYDNAVEVVELKGYIPIKDDYVFLLGFNEGIIPNEFKDEDFLPDKEKEILDESTSIELNQIEHTIISNKIKSINHLIITYRETDKKQELYISSLYDESYMKQTDFYIDYSYSNLFNKNSLIAGLDNYNKYGEYTEPLLKLYNTYKDIPYLSYNHKFKKIDNKPEKIRLSYSSLDNFFKCSFRYYLKSILKIDKQEDTFAIQIGNIFHHILFHCYEDNFDLNYYWDLELKNISRVLTNSEKYFLKRCKEDLILLIETLKEQFDYTNLKKVLLEKNITIKINDQVSFVGFVDKIMYEEFEDKTITAIIDYKTGNPDLNINNIIYGLDMQLPVYVFLIKNSNLFNNVIIGGFYLQKILNNYKTIEDKKKSLKLQGYSNIDETVLKEVDSSYEDSSVIKNLKTTKDRFSRYAKVLDSSQIDKLSELVKNNIIYASKDILAGKFDINPKEINNEIVGCKYCPYKDICFMDNSDVITLEEKELFGGEKDAMD